VQLALFARTTDPVRERAQLRDAGDGFGGRVAWAVAAAAAEE
jgi:hypothetical protein